MKERPILFSAPMVRSILSGEKTQTRRLVRPARGYDQDEIHTVIPQGGGCWGFFCDPGPGFALNCPYGVPGDRLWVRETHAIRRVDYYCDDDDDDFCPRQSEEVYYRATPRVGRRRWIGPDAPKPNEFQGQPHAMTYLHESSPLESGPAAKIARWTPSIHMPRWASRLTLEITDVCVERLQDITEADILAEGVTVPFASKLTGIPWSDLPTLHHAWAAGWNHINGDRATWASNPWVWVIDYKQVCP